MIRQDSFGAFSLENMNIYNIQLVYVHALEAACQNIKGNGMINANRPPIE